MISLHNLHVEAAAGPGVKVIDFAIKLKTYIWRSLYLFC